CHRGDVLRRRIADRGCRSARPAAGHGQVACAARDAQAADRPPRGGTMRDHTEIEELLALEALGGLEAGDRARLVALLEERPEDSAEIEQLRAEFSDTAAMLGAGLEPTPLSADLEQRTVAAALAVASSTAPKRRWRAALVAVAAAVFLVAVGAIIGYVTAPPTGFEAFVQQPGVQ